MIVIIALVAAFQVPSWRTEVAVGPKVSGQVQSSDDNGRVLAFGGLTGSAGSPTTNELWAFEKDTWTKLETEAGGPVRLQSSHNLVLWGMPIPERRAALLCPAPQTI